VSDRDWLKIIHITDVASAQQRCTVAAMSTTTKGKLTPHQREVYNRILRISRRLSPDVSRYRWVDAGNIGSRGACAKLVAKGWIAERRDYGPRGGEHFQYRPIVEEAS
jgi:hypothetical protein